MSTALFDPMSRRSGVAAQRNTAAGAEVYVQLAPGQSCILKTFAKTGISGARFEYWRPDVSAAARPLTGPWTLTFTAGGPTLPAARTSIDHLGSWTDLGGDDLKAFSGTAVYRTTFDAPGAGDQIIELGRVAESARVRVNGREVGAVIAAPWQVVVRRDTLRPTGNELEITVTNLGANRIADLDRRDPSWKHFYNTNYPARIAANRGPDGNFSAAKWAPRVSGLIGPVSLQPAIADVPQ
jgi:hypothetical protein